MDSSTPNSEKPEFQVLAPTRSAQRKANEIRWPPLFKWQREFLERTERIIAICVGRRSGKAVALARRLFFGPKGLYQGFNVAIMAHLRDGCIHVEKELISRLGPFLVPHPKRDGYIYTPTGAEVHIWTLGNKATAMRAGRGEAYGTIVIDEAAWCASLYDAFMTAIQPTLADHVGHAIFASTPKGQKNDFFRIFRGVADIRIQGSVGDLSPLPNIQEDYKDKKKRAAQGRLNSKFFQQEYDADLVDLGSVLVTIDMIQRYDIAPTPPNSEVWQIHIGMDLAFSEKEEADFCAMVAVARNRSTHDYFVCDAYRFKEAQPRRMLEELKKFNAKWHASKIVS